MAERLLVDGMDLASQVTDGMGGKAGAGERDEAQKEFFHMLPAQENQFATIEFNEEEFAQGASVSRRYRGPGQFGLFVGAECNVTDIRVTVYTNDDEELALATFTF